MNGRNSCGQTQERWVENKLRLYREFKRHIYMGELPILGYHQGPQNSTIKASD